MVLAFFVTQLLRIFQQIGCWIRYVKIDAIIQHKQQVKLLTPFAIPHSSNFGPNNELNKLKPLYEFVVVVVEHLLFAEIFKLDYGSATKHNDTSSVNTIPTNYNDQLE